MGLYASVVLVIGKFVREFFSGISHSIMFEELPCVDRILKLCTDIFLVRWTFFLARTRGLLPFASRRFGYQRSKSALAATARLALT